MAQQTSVRPGSPGGDERRPSTASTGLPFSLVLGLLAGIAVYATSLTPLRDIDVFWHVLAGRELLDGSGPGSLGEGWSFSPGPLPWTSSQWLAEVLFALLHDAFGWAGLAAFRVVTAGLAIGALAWSTLKGRVKPLAGFPFLLATVVVAFVSQDRPQQFTLIGAGLLGGVLATGLTDHRLPQWWVVLPATVLWANLHGGWILAPFVFGLIALGVAIDHGPRLRFVWSSLALAASSVVAGCLTPSGIAGLTAPLRFSDAASLIREWRPVEPASALGWLTIAMLGLFLIGWSASSSLPRSEGLVVLALMTFTWLAYRNLAPGLALLAPLAAHRLICGFPRVGRPEPAWSAPTGIAAAVLLTIAGVVSVAGAENLPTASQPIGLARRIAELPTGQRVLNDYNVSGVVLFFAGDRTRVAIDGRTDRYGGQYIQEYLDLLAQKGEWEDLLTQLVPTAALLQEDTPIARTLVRERGWSQLGDAENGYVLIVADDSAAGT